MEKRPLSKLAVVSFLIPIMTIVAGIIALILAILNVDMDRYHYLTIILATIAVLLIFGNIPVFVIGIIALIKIKKYDLQGKTIATIGTISIPIILICILIIVPAIIRDRGCGGCGNEPSAIGHLRMLVCCEATWRQGDTDGNGRQDYWTYDLSCFYRMFRADGVTKVEAIDIAFAKADMASASLTGNTTPFGAPGIASWTNVISEPKSGYCYMAMTTDENGKPYNQNPVGTNKIPAANSDKFSFVAYPAVYGSSGIRTFIVNEKGFIYGRDMGSDANKIILRWPDATELKKWRIYE